MDYSILDDNTLVTLSIQGDMGGFVVLRDRHKLRWNCVLRGMTFRTVAQDLIDEYPTRLWELLHKYDPNKGCQFSTYVGHCARWAYLIALRQLRDHDNIDTWGEHLAASGKNPAELTEIGDMIDHIGAIVARNKVPHFFIERYGAEYTDKELAAKHNCSKQNINKCNARAMAIIRASLAVL